MNLDQYLSEQRGRLTALANEIGAHYPDVSRWAKGKRPIPVEYGAPIEKATGGLVTRRDLYPTEVWQRMWPELVESAAAPS